VDRKIKKFLIGPKITIKQALKRMDEAGEKILFVTDPNNNQLLGTVTDGDFRRWILKGRSLDTNITKAMNTKPLILEEGYHIEEAKRLMMNNEIECIPILDQREGIVSAIWWLDIFKNQNKKYGQINIPVVIMAGGEGVRLSPFTKILPKPLMPVGEKPIIELIIDKFVEYGCKKFYLSVNYKSNLIKTYFSNFKHDYKIEYVEEKKPLGTAGSLYLLKKKIETTFYVINSDVLIEADYADVLDFHKNNKNKITLISSMKHYKIPYGVCEIKNGGNLKKIKEKPEYDFLVNSGMYVLEPEVIWDIPINKTYDIPELINVCIKNKKKVGVYPISERSWLDIGEWEGLQNTLKSLKLNRILM